MSAVHSDVELVRESRAGSAASYNTLVKKYQKRIFKLVFRILNNVGDAEDVVQESFLCAYSGLNSFRGDSTFYTWLVSIALNAARSRKARTLRAARSLVDLHWSDEGVDKFAPCDLDCPLEILQSRQMLRVLRECLDELSPDNYKAFSLREFDGLSYDQVSKAMVCPIGTVRSRIFRARSLISARLADTMDVPGAIF